MSNPINTEKFIRIYAPFILFFENDNISSMERENA